MQAGPIVTFSQPSFPISPELNLQSQYLPTENRKKKKNLLNCVRKKKTLKHLRAKNQDLLAIKIPNVNDHLQKSTRIINLEPKVRSSQSKDHKLDREARRSHKTQSYLESWNKITINHTKDSSNSDASNSV